MGLRDWWAAQHEVPQLERAKTLAQFSTYDLLVPHWARYNFDLFIREAYRTNPLVHECIEYRCRAISTATMYAMREVDDGKERLTKGHWLQKLLRRPSQLYPSQTAWIRQIERHLLITGECFIYLARADGSRNSRGLIEETQILPAHAIQVQPGKDGIDHYEYRPNGITQPIIIAAEDMIFLRYDDPDDQLRGCSPLYSAWREIQTDNNMVDYRKVFFENAAIPSFLLATQAPGATPEMMRQMSEDFQDKFGGPKKSGKTPVVANLEVQRLGTTAREVDFGEIGAIPEARITAAFSVPAALVGTKLGLSNANYSNLHELRYEFWEGTIVPEIELIQDTLTVAFTRHEDDNFCEFDVSRVPGLQGQREKEQAIAKEGLINGAIMVNEYRQQIGYNPVDDGNVYTRPSSLTPIPEGDLDEKPPDPMEMLQASTDAEIQKGEALAKTNGTNATKDPTANKGGRPALQDKEQKKAPQPGSSNDRAGQWEYDERLLEVLDNNHQQQNAAILGDRWDRALYVLRVAGDARKPLGRIARQANPNLDSEALSDWLDTYTLALGNEAAELASWQWSEHTSNHLLQLAETYTRLALDAFPSGLTDSECAELELMAAAVATEVMERGEAAYQFKEEWEQAAALAALGGGRLAEHVAERKKGGKHGPSIKCPDIYEALRRKGKSKKNAAQISNECWKSPQCSCH